jgi:RNA polymerase sigma-70 factor (ECF subfamily)
LRRKKLIIQPYDAAVHDHRHSKPGNHAEANELNNLIIETLQDLPENQAAVLTYRDLDQLEYAEIAALMDLKIENVRMLLSRARKKLAEKLLMIYNYEVKERKSTGA